MRLSTAYHPQTDDLSERAVQTLKQYLRIFCHDRQNRWVAWLALAEFAYNSTPSTHGYSPFHALYGFQPRTIHLSEEEIDITAPAAEEWLGRMTTVHSQITAILKKLSLEKSRQFKIGDWVLVDRRNLTVKAGNNRSLMQKWIGLYQVIKVIGRHAYKLDLPRGIRIHNVVHTTMLKPFIQRQGDEMQIDDEENELFFDVDQILDSKTLCQDS